jgi:ABC-type spermidine/putrescine transport system permease subunit I
MLVWAQVLAYRTDVFGGAVPSGWADFWDAKRFPGDRTLVGAGSGNNPELEFALLAASVPADKLYPLDLDKAFASYDKIKPDVVKWWETGAVVSLSGLAKDFAGVGAVRGISLDVTAGEFLTLLGPSGSGKSTTLMMIAGFETPSAGDISIDGKSVVGVSPHKRNIGMVFQNYALFPHLTVADNIGFPLKQRGIGHGQRMKMVAQALDLVRLPGYGARYPGQLSGGQQQRVAFTTLHTAIAVTCGCLLLGYPVAMTLVRPGRMAGVALMVVLIPFWTSILVRSYAWMVLLGRRGLLNEALLAAGVIDHPLRILNTSIAVHIAMIHILLPYMIPPIANALRQIDPSLGRAALGLGATPYRVFREVTLPLSMPGVAAGMLLVFVLSLGFYITPALVGGPRDMTVSILIAQQVDQLNWPYAACPSVALLTVTLIIMAVFQRLFGMGSAFRLTAR